MPTYEYACKKCGRHTDVFQRISEEPLKVCPHCGGELRKVFHPAGILLKGSGFYKTDSRPKEKTSSESSSSSPSKSSGSEKKNDSGSKEKSA